jgi:membrane associated rhomboid family serine protease
MLDWLIRTREGLVARVCAGAFIFLCLALWDLKKHGRAARRWKEYVFLIVCVIVAMIYGAVNDQVTSAISWEYFYYGKELEAVLGPTVPPDRAAMRWEAAKIGMMATWSVGLLLGAALLIASNPKRNRPSLAPSRILALLPVVLLITITCGAIFGLLGWLGALNWLSSDFAEMWKADMFRPRHFTAAWGAHLGGYIGGLMGGAHAAWRIVRQRRVRTVNVSPVPT